ncbi:RNA polymerase subunit sigma [Clostridium botulinum]|nr:RNA polymerase subunit sigma [Clostridium botulinum]
MSLYKKTEAMLYNYNKTKSEIKNIDLDLKLLKSEIDGVGAIVYEEKTAPTNKFNSSVENEVIAREHRIKKLEQIKLIKEVEIEKIDNTLSNLTEREYSIISRRYFNKEKNRYIAAKLDLTEEYICELKAGIINNIIKTLFLNKV